MNVQYLLSSEADDCREYSIDFIVREYADMLYKLAAAHLGNRSDAFDAVQDVMLKIHVKKPRWNSVEHLKAWLIRAIVNRCRDYNRRTRTVDLSEAYGVSANDSDYDLQNAAANLPQKYKTVLYLHYYSGYKISEIAKILKVGESGVKKRLVKGREMLKNYL